MKTLLVLVPGYDAAAARNDALNCLKDGIASIHDDSISSQATRGKSSGWIVTRGADSVEMYEAFWQDQIQMLSDSKPYIRVLNGLWMSLLWLNPRTILILRHSFMWLLATIGGAFLLTLWLYGAVAVLLVSLGNLIPNGTSLPMPSSGQIDAHKFLESYVGNVGVQMQQFWLWAWASVLVAIAGIRLDSFANLLDLVPPLRNGRP